MAEQNSPPSRSDIESLYERLVASDEEIDETTSAKILQEHGIDPRTLLAGFRERIEWEVRKMQKSQVQVASQPLFSLCDSSPTQPTEAEDEANAWIDSLLSNVHHSGSASATTNSYLPPFANEFWQTFRQWIKIF
jgi:hypothetical protein